MSAPTLPPTKCRHCGAEIVWAVTESGQHVMPVEVTPRLDGNLVLWWEEIEGIGPLDGRQRVRVALDHERVELGEPRPLWRSHHVACPDALERRARQHTEGPGT